MEEEKHLLVEEMKSYLLYYKEKINEIDGSINWIDHQGNLKRYLIRKTTKSDKRD